MNEAPVIGVVLDTETTGTGEDAQVIQLAYTELNSNLEQSGKTVCTYHLPTVAIEWGALATHHLSHEKLRALGASFDKPQPPVAAYYIGHNVDFDWKALGSPPDVRRICTLALARYFWPDTKGHTLGACTYRICTTFAEAEHNLASAHDAKTDIVLCYNLLLYFAAKASCKTLHDLWLLSETARIPTIMPFGKHKGERIADIPRAYKTWALKQTDFDEYVLIAFRQTM